MADGPEAIWEELSPSIKALLKPDKPIVPDTGSLSPHEERLMSLLTSEEIHIDELIEISRLSPAEVSATLVQLELKGFVRQTDGKMFISNLVSN